MGDDARREPSLPTLLSPSRLVAVSCVLLTAVLPPASQELTLAWEKLRRKNLSVEERSKLVVRPGHCSELSTPPAR